MVLFYYNGTVSVNWTFLIIFLLSGASAVAGNLLLKSGINGLGSFELEPRTIVTTLLKFAGSWQILLGFFFYAFSSLLYLKLLTSGEVTRIYPAVVSYMFIMLLLFGGLFLKESITISKVVGVLIIIIGIFAASR